MRIKNELFGQHPAEVERAIIAAQRSSAIAKSAVDRMEVCHRNWQQREEAIAGQRKGHDLVHRRCRSLLCPSCQDERWYANARRIGDAFYKTVIDDIERNGGTLTAHHMMFLGQPYPLSSARLCLDDTFGRWETFSSRKVFQHAVAGYARGIELDIFHDTDTVSSSVTVMALVRTSSHANRRGGWKRLWQLSGDKEHTQLVGLESWDPLEVETEFFIDRTLSTALVGARPTNLCQSGPSGTYCDPTKLAVVQDALKGRRLFQFGGAMRRK